MTESAEGGASLAWRLLAVLEGGSLVLAASALLAYSARHRKTERRPVHTVLVSNTSNALGKEIKSRLESHGCVVSVPSDTSEAEAEAEAGKVDALVVVGQDGGANSLDGMADLVTRDVYDNLKVLESLSHRVRRGGRVAWACAGAAPVPSAPPAPSATPALPATPATPAPSAAPNDAFRRAGDAFDTVLRASLQHVADRIECSPVWVGRHPTMQAAERVVSALVPSAARQSSFSIGNAAHKIGEYLGRWLKNVA